LKNATHFKSNQTNGANMGKIHIYIANGSGVTLCWYPIIKHKSIELSKITPSQLELGGFCNTCLKQKEQLEKRERK
jgi:hypothetical protein